MEQQQQQQQQRMRLGELNLASKVCLSSQKVAVIQSVPLETSEGRTDWFEKHVNNPSAMGVFLLMSWSESTFPFEMNASENRSAAQPPRSDYVWQYEYYDEDEPVSFEGLKAHRYSIVIGFWVGLAVFVLFMFFVLMLLTKTGAPPHQENTEASAKHHRAASRLADLPPPDDPEKAFSRPLLGEPRSLFHFYISEEEHQQHPHRPQSALGDQGDPAGGSPRTGARGRGRHWPTGRMVNERPGENHDDDDDDAGLRPTRGAGGGATRESALEDTEDVLMAHFNIPNFVNSESPGSCSLGDDNLLMCESPLPPDSRSLTLGGHSGVT
ncbi:hypothetical protein CRUP_037544 [Coryphaenoides rupestris]|nr:hypothetical protein CRUP_037544 [Coryphaenoides rupestris]